MKNRNIILTTILFALGTFALTPGAQAVSPAPDGGYAGGNTAEGQNALLSLTSGLYNTAIGFDSLLSNSDANFNTGVGAGALLVNTADSNTATGAGALLSNTTGADNTANGAFALFTNIAGTFNTATGFQALKTNTGDRNTANGADALLFNAAGGDNTADGNNALRNNSDGNDNTATGGAALSTNISGSSNTADGVNALLMNTASSNTGIGRGALGNNTSGDHNIGLGLDAGGNVTTASNAICIGTDGNNVSDSCYIGNIFTSTVNDSAVFVNSNGRLGITTSSRRFKEEIKPMDKASEALLAFKPVTFRYKKEIDPDGRAQFGLVAEEVEKVNPDLVVRDKEGKAYSVRYEQVNAMLLNEFLKEHRTVQELRNEIAALTSTVKEQASQIQNVSAQLAAASPSRGGVEVSKFARRTAGRIRRGGPAPQV